MKFIKISDYLFTPHSILKLKLIVLTLFQWIIDISLKDYLKISRKIQQMNIFKELLPQCNTRHERKDWLPKDGAY